MKRLLISLNGTLIRPVKINSLFLILRARSFSSDSAKNQRKKQRFIFHFSITIIFVFSFLFCLRARAFNLGKFWTRNKPFILSGLSYRMLVSGKNFCQNMVPQVIENGLNSPRQGFVLMTETHQMDIPYSQVLT